MYGQGLDEFATPVQAKYLAAVRKHGGLRPAARALGVAHQPIVRALHRLRAHAASRGIAPEHDMTHATAPGFHVRGVSTLYTGGAPVAQWVKTQADREKQTEALLDAVREIAEPFRLRAPKCATRTHRDDLLSVYVAGDPHIGMYAWDAETGGGNFDLELAESTLCRAVDRLVSVADPSERALIVSVGDLTHYDGMVARTARSGNALDADGRYARMVSVAMRSVRRCIETALTKHRHVSVICQQGNHDEATSLVLAIALSEIYRDEKRIGVDTSPNPFHYSRFGKNLIGVTHGDRTKLPELPGIMATDRPEDWGATTHRRWITGHVHHDQTKEYPGCIVETFRTLAPRDSWANASGYRSGRDMRCITLHREHGELVRHTVGIGQISPDAPERPAKAVSFRTP